MDGGVSSDWVAPSVVPRGVAVGGRQSPVRSFSRLERALATGAAAEHLTDAELITLSLNGLEPAFSRLLERHARHLRRLVTGRLRNPEDVLDVLQETHLAVWRALESYDACRPFEAWITSIALNKCRDWARHRAAYSGLLIHAHTEAVHAGRGIDERCGERLLIEKEGVRNLGRALHRLPRELRQPLVLTSLRDLSQAAAARRLRLTRKAVEMRVRRARLRLAETLRA